MSALDPVRSRATEGLAIEQIRARIERDLRPETLAHVHGTAGVARELALAHGLDPHRAELAALLHDVAHDYSDQELLRLAEQHRIPLSLTEARIPRLIHGWVGAAVLASEWGITDAELLDAVRFHISGSPTMGMLAKVVFVADKVEPHRS